MSWRRKHTKKYSMWRKAMYSPSPNLNPPTLCAKRKNISINDFLEIKSIYIDGMSLLQCRYSQSNFPCAKAIDRRIMALEPVEGWSKQRKVLEHKWLVRLHQGHQGLNSQGHNCDRPKLQGLEIREEKFFSSTGSVDFSPLLTLFNFECTFKKKQKDSSFWRLNRGHQIYVRSSWI